MVAILFDGLPTSSIMLFLNVFSLIGIILLLDCNFGGMLRSNYRNKAAVMIVSMPFMMTATLLAQPIVLFSLLVVASICLIKQRTELFIIEQELTVDTGNISIPLLLFASIFTNGILGLLIPLFTLAMVLFTLKKRKYFFKIMPLNYFLLIAFLMFFWIVLTFFEAGAGYTI